MLGRRLASHFSKSKFGRQWVIGEKQSPVLFFILYKRNFYFFQKHNIQSDADKLHGSYFADISSSNKQKLKIFFTKLKLLKRRINADQTEQNRSRRLEARSFCVHLLKISDGKSLSFFVHFCQLHLAIMRDGGVYLGH